MQASWKGALPLFGILERKRGKGIDCDVTRVHTSPRSGFPANLGIRGASGTAERWRQGAKK